MDTEGDKEAWGIEEEIMGKGPKVPQEKEALVMGMLAIGEKSQDEIAKAVGVHQCTVSRINIKHKELIESAQARLIESVMNPIVDRTIKEIDAASKMDISELRDSKNQKFLDRVDKKEEGFLKGVGIAASHSQSIHVQNIFNNNSKTVLNPVVMNLLSEHTKNLRQDVEDACILQSEEG